MSRKKILFIIWSYSLGGGAEKILSSIVRSIHDEFDIDLLEVEHFDVSWEELPDEVNVLDPIYDHTKGGLLNKLACAAKRGLCFVSSDAFRAIARKTSGYDCVIAFNYLLPASLVFPKEISIMWNHESVEDLTGNPRWLKREEKALASANAIVAISGQTKKSIQNLFPSLDQEIELIYNGFDIDAIRGKAKLAIKCELPENAIAWVGRLDDNKNPLAALDIFSKAVDLKEDISLHFIGQGNLKKAIEEKAASLGLGEKVHFLGYQDNPYPLIEKAGCVLSTSKHEGFPTILVEALALGTPFVCSNVAGSKEISNNGEFGFVYEGEEDAARAICDYLSDPPSAVRSEEMRKHVASFSLEKQKEAIVRLIEGVCKVA